MKLNSVEIQGAYNSYTRVYTLPQTQIYSIQGVEAPSTMKLIKVCEYSLKVLGESIFITNCSTIFTLSIIKHAKRKT
ncbi:unnamed protein product (macronuclear) [Paramecium tetraurelia]|uniref:Uncharacterized protein n=1 Tax=Paramecium tetraurelia TaxID=5888 RepID=A0CYU0_PARTE|nr:uncharacterized protein GSPATT00011558001 [Paramecium tetraurelia]CAK75957.1 unnamed protein product [Paramecium tetraurelia]|eukprot:XP_001443354.1 hypothetical protein (macronuclear) [Paramecium tetraurelia strain d4-2]